jgi:hypothetical protein
LAEAPCSILSRISAIAFKGPSAIAAFAAAICLVSYKIRKGIQNYLPSGK